MAARKLKVFQAQFGFYDTVVAAPSQAVALKVWGTHQNLFANGEAKVTTDNAAVAAALKHPETLLRRAVGSNDAFELEPAKLPRAPNTPKRAAAKAAAEPRAARNTKLPADRTALDAAETALHKLNADRKRAETDFLKRQGALDAERSSAQAGYVKALKVATAAVVSAHKIYKDGGGR